MLDINSSFEEDFSKSWTSQFDKVHKVALTKHKFTPKQVNFEMLMILNVIFQKKEISIRELSRELLTLYKVDETYYGLSNTATIINSLYELKKHGLITTSSEVVFKITKKGGDFRNQISSIWFQPSLLVIKENLKEQVKYFERLKQELNTPV